MAESSSQSYSGLPWYTPSWGGGTAQYGDWVSGITPNLNAPNTSPMGAYQGGPGTKANPLIGQQIGQFEGGLGALEALGGKEIGAAKHTSKQEQGLAKQLQALAASQQGDLSKAYQTAFDPNNAQEQYYLQQTKAAAGAQEAASGLAGTPYGAGATGAATAAFTNQWALNADQRMATGVAAATSIANQIASDFTSAGQLDSTALSGMLEAYGLSGSQLSSALQEINALLGNEKISASTSQSQSSG